jgi:hypothetical protein
MKLLTTLFVGHPVNVLIVGIIFLTVYGLVHLKFFEVKQGKKLILITTIAWWLYTAWDWQVQVWTPEANIRVDLMIIWPVLAILSLWSIYYLLRNLYQNFKNNSSFI